MNRPDVHNAFNYRMQQELKTVWRSARHNDDVRCLVLTGAGAKAFCTGIDRQEAMGHWTEDEDQAGKAGVAVGSGRSLALLTDIRPAPRAPRLIVRPGMKPYCHDHGKRPGPRCHCAALADRARRGQLAVHVANHATAPLRGAGQQSGPAS